MIVDSVFVLLSTTQPSIEYQYDELKKNLTKYLNVIKEPIIDHANVCLKLVQELFDTLKMTSCKRNTVSFENKPVEYRASVERRILRSYV